ncbi:hypothetical protein ACIRQH_35180 [Streptomyces sp. NPDC102279]|uniref:hypothetical protein n=1 Tax=Streptomyces sp. NPDC102279 TaxID=3366153 RepID=UPI0038221F7F
MGLLDKELKKAKRRMGVFTFLWGAWYRSSRAALIVAAAAVAAGDHLHGKLGWLMKWQPALALAVGILTAMDSWLRPHTKWQGSMKSRDDFVSLAIQSEGGLPADEVRSKVDEIRAEHRDRNLL